MKWISISTNWIINLYEKHRICSFLLICIVVGTLCRFMHFKSFRNMASDAIAIVSITLAILGLFLGILISLKEDSVFFKQAKRYELDKDIFKDLLKTITNSIYINIIFIASTLMYDVMPTINNKVAKYLGNILWAALFVFLLIETTHIVYLIYKIYTFEVPKTNTRTET
ncbi:hypothetical protein NB814_00965 [Latilactobacillus curvatus]|uniref:hypothetical protein n=1 Tax=Latilactobacillus curvatus TaxID=28038 RepID=UPI002030D5C9|nr:hypothetical protein [Latilactobacillus curvatus]MCM0724324.1 hypothetical protein [Latilactobacillus curvatus]